MTVVEFGDRHIWHKAERSASQGGNCVCVAADANQTGIRDSKEGPSGSSLWVRSSDWAAFLSHVIG